MTTQAVTLRTDLQSKLATIDEKLKAIKATADSQYKTNGEFRFNPSYTVNSPIYIHKTQDLKILISALGYINKQSQAYNETASNILKLDSYPVFEWQGYSFDAWENDIQIRVAIVTQHDLINKLKTAKQKLEQFMSDEDRLAIALKDVDALIG